MRQWYKLADRLGQPVELVMRTTSATQFIQWQEYLRQEPNDFHREDVYFNRILLALYRLLYKNTGKSSPYKDDDFQLQFIEKREQEDASETKQAQSKAYWTSVAGLKTPANVSPFAEAVLDKILNS